LPPATVVVRGVVIAKGTRQPLAGAAITVDAEPAGEADADGRFAIEVREGHRRIQIQHPGYEPMDVAVDARGQVPGLVLRLQPRLAGERYETVVTPPDERGPRTSLRDDELTRVPGSFGDPFRVIESLPGVSQVVWPLALYAIRGANPGNTGFFVDGIRMPALFHFALGPSVIHPFFLQQIDFYPGGYPPEYGRYVSGIVAARTAAPATDRMHASVDARLFDAGGLVATPFDEGRGNVAVAGRVSYTGLLFSAFSPDYRLNYWDYQARVEHRLGPGRVTLFAFGSGDDLAQKVDQQGANLQFHRVDLRWDGAVLGGRALAAVTLGRDSSDTSLRALVGDLPVGVRTTVASPRVRYTHALASWIDLEAGGDAEAQRFRPVSGLPSILASDRSDLFADRNALATGGYLGLALRVRERLSIAPTLRYDYYAEQGTRSLQASPRLVVRVRPAGDVWLKGSLGRFTQLPSLPVAVPGFETFGLADYGTQSSIQGSLGVEAPLGRALSLDLTGFYQRLRLTDLESLFDYDPQRKDVVELRDGRSYGAEVLVRRSMSERLYGWLAYTYSRSQRVIGFYNQRIPSDWDQPHILNFVLGYRLARGWSVGTRVHYNSGRPYPVFQERSDSAPEYVPLPAFLQVDARIDKRFVLDRWLLDAYLELVNTTLSREVYDLRRRADGVLQERGYRIVLPSLGVRAEW
jgi:hypothetical protein